MVATCAAFRTFARLAASPSPNDTGRDTPVTPGDLPVGRRPPEPALVVAAGDHAGDARARRLGEGGAAGTGRVRIVPHPEIGAAGVHRPLEISRATAAAGACAEAARFPQVHSAFLVDDSHANPSIRGPVMMGTQALTCPRNRGNLTDVADPGQESRLQE